MLDTLATMITSCRLTSALVAASRRRSISSCPYTAGNVGLPLAIQSAAQALQATMAIIQQYPFMAAPYMAAGDVLVRQGRLVEALAYYGAASDLEDSAGLQGAMGDVRMLMRRPSEAIPSYERAVEMERNANEAGNLQTVKGLGRHWTWKNLVAADRAQLRLFEDCQAPLCDVCFDG